MCNFKLEEKNRVLVDTALQNRHVQSRNLLFENRRTRKSSDFKLFYPGCHVQLDLGCSKPRPGSEVLFLFSLHDIFRARRLPFTGTGQPRSLFI